MTMSGIGMGGFGFKEEGDEEDDGECVVKLRGLPWSATKEDILDFFSECRIKKGREGIHLVTSSEGRSTGEAFVEFSVDEDINNFIKKDKQCMGHRYIEVFEVKKAEMDWFLRRNRPPPMPTLNIRGSEDADCFVRLRGLPFECTKEDIQQFFEGGQKETLELKGCQISYTWYGWAGLEVVPNGIQLMVDSVGRSIGESYVQFVSSASADEALSKDRQCIGHRYIEVFRVSPSELRMLTPRAGGPAGRPFNNRPTPYDRGGRDRDSGRFGGQGAGGMGGRSRYFSKGFEDDSWTPYSNDGDGSWNRGNQGPQPLLPGFKRGYSTTGSSGSGRFGGGSGGPKGAVSMRGLPFKATEDDIREFFDPVIPTSINVIYEPSGRPSGTATVQFASSDEVARAMMKNKDRMEHRYIELFENK